MIKIEAKNWIIPFLVCLILFVWYRLIFETAEVIQQLEQVFVVLFLHYLIIRVDNEKKATYYLGSVSIILWFVVLWAGAALNVLLIWIAICTIFYIVTVAKNIQTVLDIIKEKRRNKYY